MTPRAWTMACAAALPPPARALFDQGGLDPAEAWLAQIEGKTNAQARAQARRLRGSAAITPGSLADASWLCGSGADPLLVLEAVGAAALDSAALTAAEVAADFEAADTGSHAQKIGRTQRRVQQIFKARRERAERQLELFVGVPQ